MTKTNVQSTPSNSQHHDTPNNKTHIIKFRVTAEEKASLELTCKLLNLSLPIFIRRAMDDEQMFKGLRLTGAACENIDGYNLCYLNGNIQGKKTLKDAEEEQCSWQNDPV